MTQLSLDDVERHALAGELERMRVTELVRCEPAPHSRSGGEVAELDPDPGGRPGPTARWTVDHAEQRADRQPLALGQPGTELLEALPGRTSNQVGELSYAIGRIASRTEGASCWGVVPELKLRIQSARSGSAASIR
jgi:hypothetical protein